MARYKPVVLTILDGWGLAGKNQGNAIFNANTNNMDRYFKEYPSTTLEASGEAVGLPAGQMGNSEVGHLNIGAGRIVYQDLTRISKAISNGEFFNNPVLINACKNTKKNPKSSLHLMGLLSDGGVHSHIEHLFALVDLANKIKVKNLYIHCFLDGRDVPPKSAITYIEKLEAKLKKVSLGRIATVSGRYYAMDRDKRWDRVEKAYKAMVLGIGEKAVSAKEAVEKAYARDITDEFVLPTVIVENNKPVSTIKNGDSVIFFNFRADRAREITRALIDQKFNNFQRVDDLELYYVCMTQYDETIAAPIAFPQERFKNTLGEYLAVHGLKQLRIAETEKYAHVTFFFNGGEEVENTGEDRILIPSSKVATYDLKPEMSACEVTERVVNEIEKDKYDFIVLNYANPDMVGHTGNFQAAVKAVEIVDQCLQKVVDVVIKKAGVILITADHGNAEEMLERGGTSQTAHTTNPVPLVVIGLPKNITLKQGGSLRDLAPTILELLELEKPSDMTGQSLLQETGCIK
jgi:2,3-bisphosphoglycerate-independent phosphoglycerate mutase